MAKFGPIFCLGANNFFLGPNQIRNGPVLANRANDFFLVAKPFENGQNRAFWPPGGPIGNPDSAKAYFYDSDGGKIESSESMKVLGFHFSAKPGMHAQVEVIRKKFRKLYWTLFNLRKTGFTDEELAQVYRTVMRPSADYCQVVYHSLITDEQDQVIERLQSKALKCIYGPKIPYARMREMAGVTTLRQRRIDACDKFATTCLKSPRFQKWFPVRQGRSGRNGEKFQEEFARCDRLKNSPIFYFRRRMNGKEGRTYGERNRKYRDT